MSKVKEVAIEKEEKGMVNVEIGSLLPTADDVRGGLEAPGVGAFLLGLKMVFPIEIKPNSNFNRDDAYKVGITDGSNFSPLKAPFTLVVIDARNSRRLLVDGEDGSKEYVRAYEPLNRGGEMHGKSGPLYQKLGEEPQVLQGNSFVVAILDKDGGVAIAVFELFKTQRSYWWPALTQAMFTNRVGCRVEIDDHYPNVVESKARNAYPSPAKFKQWKIVDLGKEQVGSIAAALRENAQGFMNWLGK